MVNFVKLEYKSGSRRIGGQGKEGSRKPRPPGWDDHLGARKPLFGEAALSAFSTRMASSTKSKS